MTAIEHKAIARHEITGVILAGGRGSRLGGVDKGLVHMHGRPFVEHAIDALRPQVGSLLISANRNRDVYASYGFPVVADAMGDYDGPLAGMLSAMRVTETTYILVVPCDTPALPSDLVERLASALTHAQAEASVVFCHGRMQPVFALMRSDVDDRLEQYMTAGARGAGEWMHRLGAVSVDFSDRADAFDNINTPEELKRLEEKVLQQA
ncbi:MAG: molybdenum cofactor guanylyltransferase [Sulfuricaulis sp.]|uniref:molybdenum cofactor guanylyltransferase MobA n=1 Tax=Sulfuricaulis sp. TaxID=2003553 RepID=UPI0025D7ED7D|nr:molybdenum cofactor guanylyltransferase MobA [Sulfuricaulis sp.]MCR4346649.1 molybdenum cofactor guanylyltransferase [Sulfuricaulis sp.]